MAATVQTAYYNGISATAAPATTGAKWNREDTQTGTTPIPIPSGAGTNFSWRKTFGFNVTATSTTTISNRTISSAAPPAGLALFAQDGGTSYAQSSAANKPADAGTNANTPTGYTALTTYGGAANAAFTWQATGVATSALGLNGDYVLVCCGLDATYAGGGGTNNTAPTLTFSYTEQ